MTSRLVASHAGLASALTLGVFLAVGTCATALAEQVGVVQTDSVAGLTMTVLNATTPEQTTAAVETAKRAGLTDIQIANALGRAFARVGSTEPLRRAMALASAENQVPVSDFMAAFYAGEMTAEVLADYRGISNTPWGGSAGATGGRNE